MPEERTDIEKPLLLDETSLVRGYPRSSYPDAYGYGYGEPQQKLNLRQIWYTIKKRKWLVAVIALIVTSIVTVATFQSKSIYQASTTIEIDHDNGTLYRSGEVVIQTDEAGDAYLNTLAMKNKMRVLQSRPLLDVVVATLNLDKDPRFVDVDGKKSIVEAIRTIASKFQGGTVPPQHTAPTPPEELNVESERSAEESARLAPYVGILSSHLSAEPLEDTSMLVVSFSHTDPQLAATIVNTVAKMFIDRSFQNSTEKFTKTSGWLEQMTAELQSRVEKAQQDVENYTREHNMFSADGKETLTADRLSRLFDEETKAESNRILKQSLYEQVKAGHLGELPEAYSDPRAVELEKKIGELNVGLAQLNVKYGPDNPRLTEVKQQIDTLQQQLDASRVRLEAKLKADYERAVTDENSLKAALDQAKADAVQQNEAGIQLNILKQRVDTAKQLYTDFLQKESQAKVQVAEQHNNMRVIEPANTPTRPVGPDRLKSIMISLFLSLAAGLGLAFFLEHLDNTIKTVEDVNKYAQLPALGVIPSISAGGARKLLYRKRTQGTASAQSLATASTTPSDEPKPVQLVALDNRSSAAEAYRGLRTSVLLSSAGGPPKTVMFTSGQPGEGKTTTTINTAISLAQLGSSVIVIDCDLRKPATHKVFGITHDRGLSTYLSGENVALESVIQKLPIPHLSLIASGPVPPNPAELVSSDKMKKMLRELSERYDHVLVDSPPLMHVTDPVILSTMVDGVILVVHGGKSTRDAVRRSRQELASVGAKVFGVVLNNLDLRREGYDNYYYYSYYSGYGQEGGESGNS
ncbi:MAG TPA: polysaccharide biosynthesis tyrosine autokinase [Blastocatellia bacterium]|nr:polysaccharide biosynthesis tyrosine autokinase [Blastocatellia bacterium]